MKKCGRNEGKEKNKKGARKQEIEYFPTADRYSFFLSRDSRICHGNLPTSLSEINNKISRRSSRIILEKTLIALKRYNILIQKKLIKTEIKFNFC